MSDSSISPDSTFTAPARLLGIVAAWMAFAVSEVYAVVSGVAYASQGAAVESGPFLSCMALLVVLMGPFLVLSMVAVHAYASPTHELYSLATPIFGGNTLKTALRLVMILSGALCLAGLAWLAVSPAQAIIVGILGWGAAGPFVFLLLAHTFGRVQVETRQTPVLTRPAA